MIYTCKVKTNECILLLLRSLFPVCIATIMLLQLSQLIQVIQLKTFKLKWLPLIGLTK